MRLKSYPTYVFIGAGALTIGAYLSTANGYLSRQYRDLANPCPQLALDDEHRVSEAESGEIVTWDFKIGNSGGVPLILSSFRTGCSCDTLQVFSVNGYHRFESATVQPNSNGQFRLKQRVRGAIGKPARLVIYFETNVPDLPEANIAFEIGNVTGGAAYSVSQIDAGTIKLNKPFATHVDVYEKTDLNRKVMAVDSSDPRIHLSLDTYKATGIEVAEAHPRQIWIARIPIVIDTTCPCTIDAKLQVQISGRTQPDIIPVRARVAPLVEASPTELEIKSADVAKIANTKQIIFRSSHGETFKLTVLSNPDAFQIDFPAPNVESTLQIVRVHIPHGFQRAGSPKPLLFRVEAAGEATEVAMPLKLTESATD